MLSGVKVNSLGGTKYFLEGDLLTSNDGNHEQ